MKVTIELPDLTACVFVNYVFHTNSGMSMATKEIDSNTLRSGEVIDCRPTEKGGSEE